MRFLAALAAVAVLQVATVAPAAADEGSFTYAEYVAVSQGDSKSYVEGTLCNCSGHKVADWSADNGDPMKRVSYTTGAGGTALVNYRLRTDGVWHASAKAWCNGSGCGWDYL